LVDVQHSESILLVDDDDLAVRCLTRQLRGLGYPFVYRAGSAQDAIELLERIRPSVVLSDMVMEDREAGVRVVLAARRWGVPVAVISGLPGLDAATVGAPVHKKGSLSSEDLQKLILELVEVGRCRSSASVRCLDRVAS
jgi:CheY-like chemotaxis protein